MRERTFDADRSWSLSMLTSAAGMKEDPSNFEDPSTYGQHRIGVKTLRLSKEECGSPNRMNE